MIFYNGVGLLLSVLAAAVAWGAVGPEDGATMAAVWAAIVCVAGALYDRLAPEEGLRAYYRWVSAGASRIALMGVPVVLWPALVAVFGAAFPLFNGHAFPSPWFFTVAVLTPLALALKTRRA
ncbi:hypothetical protein [Sandaracinus amylolyticus]|uniref:Uncharacterized protein n=1 Tax=Sandaracinus amylolyticus TaxID=927083 RepID=A0A0F6SFV4_9BACT|nr:hypothetical protein [Sandaracinus amylolyticus]AKF07599.1 hypothetical protein DB32_004748 [Sandaracinus amylolyticus]